MIIDKIKNKIKGGDKMVSVLIDPDKFNDVQLTNAMDVINKSGIDLIFVGGSLISQSIEDSLSIIRGKCKMPVVLFPGSLLQISENADGILLLSLISGRNPEYLISNHIAVAPYLKKTKLEVIPTGYILIENGRTSSTQYISNTNPIPADKVDVAVATAIAGEMLGHQIIYLESGSGAENPVPLDIVQEVKENIRIPVIVGGGIRSVQQASKLFEAGADMIVIGNAFEKDPKIILQF